VTSVAFSPDGSKFITAGEDDRAEVWSAQSGQELMVASDSGDGNFDIDASFSPNGAEAVTASYDGTARIWSMQLTGPLSVLLKIARQLVTRPFSAQEKAEYLAGTS
jgi:WD40 repeat protein